MSPKVCEFLKDCLKKRYQADLALTVLDLIDRYGKKNALELPLKEAFTHIKTLNLVNVTIPKQAFDDLIDALIEGGVAFVCMEGCRLGREHAKGLKKLIKGNDTLLYLNLQGNQLGSKEVRMKPAATPRQQLVQRSSSSSEEVKISDAIEGIVKGLRKNVTLQNLILSSNNVSFSDYLALHASVASDNQTVYINLTGNALESHVASRKEPLAKVKASLAATSSQEQKPAEETAKDEVKTTRPRLIVSGSSPRTMATPRMPEADSNEDGHKFTKKDSRRNTIHVTHF